MLMTKTKCFSESQNLHKEIDNDTMLVKDFFIIVYEQTEVKIKLTHLYYQLMQL